VTGRTNTGTGVVGLAATSGIGTYGESSGSYAVWGRNLGTSSGVVGDTVGAAPAVWGHNRGGGDGVVGSASGRTPDRLSIGVWGDNGGSGYGVAGTASSGDGVNGVSRGAGVGVVGSSIDGDGVGGFTNSDTKAAIAGSDQQRY